MSTGKRSFGVAKTLFALGATLALFALILIFQYLSTAEDRVLKSFDSVKVLVATESISRGTTLADAEARKLIEIRTYPAETTPLSSVQKRLFVLLPFSRNRRFLRGRIRSLAGNATEPL